jgi:predicted DNA-binding protein
MNLPIDLNAETESRLKSAATRRGVRPEVYAKQIIEEHLPLMEGAATDTATLELLARWDAEDATTDPDEIASRRQEIDDFKQGVNENRRQAEGPDSRNLYR